jgi:hypothetical protein
MNGLNDLRNVRLGKFLSLFLFLVMLCIPFSFPLLPSPGVHLSAFLEPCISSLGSFLWHACTSCQWSIASDTEGLYLLVLLLIPVSGVLTIVLERIPLIKNSQVSSYIGSVLLLYLSMQLMRYGVSKLTLGQFGTAEANLLFTPIGMMKKDMLFWTTMGSAPLFSILSGVIEISISLLLLWRRTKLMALLGSTLVLAHIFLLDLSFQIDVRFYSLFLLLISVFLSWNVWITLFNALKNGVLAIQLHANSSEFSLAKPVLKAMFLLIILADICFPFYAETEKKSPFPKELHSAYKTIIHEGNSSFTKLFFHSRGYLIMRDEDDDFTSHKVHFIPSEHRIAFEQLESELTYSLSGDTLYLKGEIGRESIDEVFLEINLEELPLLKDSFTLTTR